MESEFNEQVPLTSARFLKVPEASGRGSSSGSSSSHLAPHPTWSDAIDPHPAGLHFREGSGNARKAKGKAAFEESEERLLSDSPHSYPPSQCAAFSEQPSDLPHHTSAPMSAPTLFSRRAAPLSLPELDEYISTLPIPAFSSRSRTKAGTEGGRFVPLDRLASTGRSIESLETNFKGKPAWRNCSLILGGLVNAVIGITVGGLHSTFLSTGRILGV